MNAKETDQRACNINAMGCAKMRKNYLMMPRPFPAADQERQSPEAWRGGQNTRRTHGGQAPRTVRALMRAHGGHKVDTRRTKGKADTWQTRFGGAAKADTRLDTRRDTRRTHGGQVLGARTQKADSKGAHMANTWRTRFGGAAKADSRRTQADTWRTSSRDAARAYRGQLFFLRENHSKLFGEQKNTRKEKETQNI